MVHVAVEGIREQDGQISMPLLARDGDGDGDASSTATAMLVFSTFVAVSGSCVYGTALGFSSPAQSGIMEELAMSLPEYSVFGSILTVGAMLGAVMSGKLADLFGRRGTMGFSDIFCIIGWLAIVFSKGAWSLDLGRLSLGYGVGVLSYVVPIYITEITPKNLRGAFTNVNNLMISCGVSVMYLVGTVINWRILSILGTIPCFILLLGLFFIPESPRWLAMKERWLDCEHSLQRLRGNNADTSKEATEIKEYMETLRQISSAKMSDLFQRRYAHSLIVGVGLMVLQQFGGITAIAFYASAIFESAGFSGRIGTIAIVIVQVPMNLLGVLLMDKLGRKPLLMISAAGTCMGCFFVGFSFLLQDLRVCKYFTPVLALGGVLVFKGSFSLGMGGIPWIIMSEIFPINMKGLAGSLVTLVNWVSSWIVSYAFNFIMSWSSEGTFFIFAGISGLTILFVEKLVLETKGRTLEEIQASLILYIKKF